MSSSSGTVDISLENGAIGRLRNCFTKRSKTEMEKVFEVMLGNQTRVNGLDNFSKAIYKMKSCQDNLSSDDITFIFQVVQKEGVVEKELFINLVRGSMNRYRDGIVSYIFKKLDKNSTGFIDFKELTTFFSHSLLPDIRDESPSAISLGFITKVHQEKMIPTDTSRPLSFLVVDDSQVTLKTTQKTLKKAGHKVELAANGKIALAKMIENFYDIVLMDIQMPVMDGIEATKLFRAQETSLDRTEPQFIIGISSSNDRTS